MAGVEREVWPRLSVTAQFVRRNFKDALGFVDVGSTWTPVAVTDPGADGVLGTADDGRPMTVYYNTGGQPARIFTNPPGAYGRYNAFQLIGTKRYGQGWELQTSYTWSRARSNYNNASPSTFPLFIVGNWTNPNVALFSDGRTDQDITHDVKTIGTYTLPYLGRCSGQWNLSLCERRALGTHRVFRSIDELRCHPCRADRNARAAGDQQRRPARRENVPDTPGWESLRLRRRLQYQQSGRGDVGQYRVRSELRATDGLGRTADVARWDQNNLLARINHEGADFSRN